MPYAVYNGKRYIDQATLDNKYASLMDGGNVIEQKAGNTLLQISINERTPEQVSISYIYSQPADRPDPLWRPDRPASGATEIPNEFFDEIAALSGLEGPFKEVFDVRAMRNDRLLNWLMRSLLVTEPDLNRAAKQGIVLIGDSCHHGPIVGSQGANQAIIDAIELADNIVENGDGNLEGFYERRYEACRKYVEESVALLAEMHGTQSSN